MSDSNFWQNIAQDILASFSVYQSYFRQIWSKLSKSKQKAIAPLRKALDGLIEEMTMHPNNAEQASALVQGVIELIVRNIAETD